MSLGSLTLAPPVVGTAGALDTGTAVGDVVELEDIGGGTAGLPAVDGSQLTGIAGGGANYTTLATVSTGEVAAGGTADVDIALPAGVTHCLLTQVTVTRTAGAATSCSIGAFADDARAGAERYFFGSSGFGVTVNPGPVTGPQSDVGASALAAPLAYTNDDGSEILRLRLHNGDFAEVGTWNIGGVVLA